MRDLKRRNAWERWQAAAGPWRPWSLCLPLAVSCDLGPRPDGHPRVRRRAQALTTQLAEMLRDGGVAMVLDLEPVLGVHVAAELNRQGLAHAVLVLPRWPYQEAVLPVDALLPALVETAERLVPLDRAANVVFVLDALRSQPIARRKLTDPRADNRYRLSPDDLPNLATLRRAGVARVVKVTRR